MRWWLLLGFFTGLLIVGFNLLMAIFVQAVWLVFRPGQPIDLGFALFIWLVFGTIIIVVKRL